jgi:hypothetical protein
MVTTEKCKIKPNGKMQRQQTSLNSAPRLSTVCFSEVPGDWRGSVVMMDSPYTYSLSSFEDQQ